MRLVHKPIGLHRVLRGSDSAFHPRLVALKEQMRGHGHGVPSDEEHWVVEELNPGAEGMPTHQAFGGANGGEYRKSFHGCVTTLPYV